MKRTRSLWRNGDFRNLWLSFTASLFGAKITSIAVPLIASVLLKASPLQMGALVAANYVPYLLIAPFAGVWLDRRPKRTTLIVTDLVRALLISLIPGCWALGILSTMVLLTIVLMVGFCTVISDIGSAAYLPSLIDRPYLVEGNGKLELSNSASNIAGNALGGGFVQLLSAPFALLLNVGAYLLSALFTFLIRHREESAAPDPEVERPTVWQDLKEGGTAVFRHRTIRRLVLATLIFNFFTFAIEPNFLIFVTRTLELSPVSIGLVFASSGVGAMAGALIAGRVSDRLGLGRTLVGSLMLAGSAAMLIPTATLVPAMWAPVLLVAMHLLDSIMVIVYNVNQRSLRAALTPDRLQGRMNAMIRMVVMGVAPAGAVIGGAMGGWIGVFAALVGGAAGILASGGSLLLSSVRTIERIPCAEPTALARRGESEN